MLSHFHQLWNDLPQIREKVALLESPNPDDDRMVKVAIIGYSYYQPIASWGCEEFNFVAQRRREVADFDELWVEFVCCIRLRHSRSVVMLRMIFWTGFGLYVFTVSGMEKTVVSRPH